MSNHEKLQTVHEDDAVSRVDTGLEKPIPQIKKVDYSGAYEKTDPKEIALVKKLDRWIMVCWPLLQPKLSVTDRNR